MKIAFGRIVAVNISNVLYLPPLKAAYLLLSPYIYLNYELKF